MRWKESMLLYASAREPLFLYFLQSLDVPGTRVYVKALRINHSSGKGALQPAGHPASDARCLVMGNLTWSAISSSIFFNPQIVALTNWKTLQLLFFTERLLEQPCPDIIEGARSHTQPCTW